MSVRSSGPYKSAGIPNGDLDSGPGERDGVAFTSRNVTHGTAKGPRDYAVRFLTDDVKFLKGGGPATAELVAKLGITSVGELLYHVPRRYEDRTNFRRVRDLRIGEPATIHGRVIDTQLMKTSRKNFTLTKVLINDNTGVALIVFFQQPYLERQFQEMKAKGRWVVVYGIPKRNAYGGPIEMERAEWEEVGDEADSLSMNRIVPIYPSTEGVTQKRLRKLVDSALTTHVGAVPDPLPAPVVLKHRLVDPRHALRNIHFPSDLGSMEAGRRRLVFQEFFLLQVGLARKRAARKQEGAGIRMDLHLNELRKDLEAILPFELTAAQKRAIADIEQDVTSGHPMNRLVQGDVGSGKTVIGLAAMLLAVRSGFQAALMAPTEILAQQHAIVLRRMLEPIGIRVDLATGSQKSKMKTWVQASILSGETQIAVGTHALIQEGVEFGRLGLVVIDEQHRFGVLQRQALQKKGAAPHVLVMTATPIPRTLTMTLYGDLDTSIVNELPPGRKPIKTHWKKRAEAGSVYSGVKKLLDEGRQAFIVCPLVEESEKLQVKAATQLAEHITKDVLPEYRIGLIHGQLMPEEKDDVMRRFKAHELDVLVATTVIEVGIDVPNASVIVLEDADRFGLAQLHQLRGRVGRGEHASYCILIADAKTEDARARMYAMVDTNDGFRIAEEDLRLRGPGEFMGTRQSGLPDLMIGDLIKDQEIMQEAREAAFEIVRNDLQLARPENAPLKRSLQAGRLGLELVSVS